MKEYRDRFQNLVLKNIDSGKIYRQWKESEQNIEIVEKTQILKKLKILRKHIEIVEKNW